MSDNVELVNMLRAVIQEELKPINERLDRVEQGQHEFRHEVNTRLTALETGQRELKKGQAAIEAAVNDLRAINRGTHKKIFAHLKTIWNDIKLIDNRLDVFATGGTGVKD